MFVPCLCIIFLCKKVSLLSTKGSCTHWVLQSVSLCILHYYCNTYIGLTPYLMVRLWKSCLCPFPHRHCLFPDIIFQVWTHHKSNPTFGSCIMLCCKLPAHVTLSSTLFPLNIFLHLLWGFFLLVQCIATICVHVTWPCCIRLRACCVNCISVKHASGGAGENFINVYGSMI